MLIFLSYIFLYMYLFCFHIHIYIGMKLVLISVFVWILLFKYTIGKYQVYPQLSDCWLLGDEICLETLTNLWCSWENFLVSNVLVIVGIVHIEVLMFDPNVSARCYVSIVPVWNVPRLSRTLSHLLACWCQGIWKSFAHTSVESPH